MTYPNSIIAGAPKCGTTSLFYYLSSHPEVCSSNIKETRYLLDKDDALFNKKRNYYIDGIEGYKHYFKHCRIDQTKIIFDILLITQYNSKIDKVRKNQKK